MTSKPRKKTLGSLLTPATIISTIQSGPIHDQGQCPLFSKFPGEIRNNIFYHALRADYGYMKTSQSYHRTALLLSCKRVYLETWFLPFTATEYNYFLDAKDYSTEIEMQAICNKLYRYQQALLGPNYEGPKCNIKLEHVRMYSSKLVNSQPSKRVYNFLNLSHFFPRCVTITIRHIDWCRWKSDAPLEIASNWVRRYILPASTRVFRLELETVERKSDQVEWMADVMRKKWKFFRADGTIMNATTEVDVKRRSGSSTIKEKRWLRDETKPETIDYISQTVTWIPANTPASQHEISSILDSKVEDIVFPNYTPISEDYTFLPIVSGGVWDQLIPPGTSAAEVKAMLRKRVADQLSMSLRDHF